MEPWRGWEGESIAHMGKGEAFLGKSPKAGLTEEGTSNALRRVSDQPYSRREGKSIHQKHSEYIAGNPYSLALCGKQDTFLALKELEVWRVRQTLHHSFISSAQFQRPLHHHSTTGEFLPVLLVL